MSTKERKEIGIFRDFNQFSKIWRTKAIYRADKIGERAKPWPTPTSTLKKEKEKESQTYLVFCPTR